MKLPLSVCSMMLAIAASANPGARGEPAKLRELDTDGDRRISLAEAQAGAPRMASRFQEIDADDDGYLSMDEVRASHPIRKIRVARSMEEDFTAADTNSDGLLTPAEAADNMPIVSDFFGEMDTNADGHVSQVEIREHARTHGPIRVVEERQVIGTEE